MRTRRPDHRIMTQSDGREGSPPPSTHTHRRRTPQRYPTTLSRRPSVKVSFLAGWQRWVGKEVGDVFSTAARSARKHHGAECDEVSALQSHCTEALYSVTREGNRIH